MTNHSRSRAKSTLAAVFSGLLAMTTLSSAQSDATLSDLVPSAGTLTPAFAGGTLTYTASVPYATTDITVTPTVTDPNATITVNTLPVTSGNPSGGISLSVGVTPIFIKVTSQDTFVVLTYTLTVTRESPNVDLSSLVPSAGTLDPAFESDSTIYTASVPYETTAMTVTPAAVNPLATITVNGAAVTSGSPSGSIPLNVGENTITTVVTAQDAATKTYTLTVTRAALFTDGTWKTNADDAWSNSANWTSDAIANGSDFTATFGDIITANRAITLDAPFTIGNITASDTTHNYTISGSNILTLDRTSGVPTIDVTTSGRALTISSEIAGSDGLAKTSAGTLVLKRDSGSNAYTGTTTLSAGTLQGNTGTSLIASIANPFGTSALQLDGGTLQLRSDSAASGSAATAIAWDNNTTVGGNATINVDRAGGSGSNKIHQLGTLSIGAFTLTAQDASSAQHDLRFGATTLTGNAIFNVVNNGGGSTSMNLTLGAVGESSPGYSLTKSGTGTLTLSAASTYSGGTVISGGTLTANADAYLGAATGGITFSGNSTLAMTGTITHNRQITLNSSVTATIQSGAGITYNNSAKVTGAGNLKFTQTGNGGRSLRFNSTANDFTGTVQVDNTSGQALAVFFNSLVDTASSGAGNIIMNMSGANGPNTFGYGSTAVAPLTLTNRRLELNGTTGTVNAIFKNENTTQSVTINSNLLISATGNKGLTLDSAAGPNNVFAGEIDNGSVSALTQVVSITKAGAGNWALSSTGNDFTGTINVNAGTLAYASAGGANPITFSNTTGSVTLSYTGSTDKTMSGAINAGSVTSGTVTLGSSGDGAVNYSNTGSLGSATNNSVRKLILSGTNTGNNILAGQWVNNTGTANAATLTKSGAGTWVLSNNTNSYTGATTVSAGKLKLGANNVIPDASNVTIGAATLDADTRTDTAGTLNVTGTAVVNLGTGAALAFANSSAVTWAGAGSLNITGTFVSGASLRFGTSNTGLNAAQLAVISVNGSGLGTYILDSNGYLVAIGGLTAFETWAGAGVTFDTDANNDGVDNGMAWVLGASDRNANAIPLLPTMDTTDPDFFIFTYRRDDDANTDPKTTIKAEYGSALTGWTTAVAGADVIITPTNDFYAAGIDKVEVKIRRTLAVDGKLFARLNIQNTP